MGSLKLVTGIAVGFWRKPTALVARRKQTILHAGITFARGAIFRSPQDELEQ